MDERVERGLQLLRQIFRAMARGGLVTPADVVIMCQALDIREEDVVETYIRCREHGQQERRGNGEGEID